MISKQLSTIILKSSEFCSRMRPSHNKVNSLFEAFIIWAKHNGSPQHAGSRILCIPFPNPPPIAAYMHICKRRQDTYVINYQYTGQCLIFHYIPNTLQPQFWKVFQACQYLIYQFHEAQKPISSSRIPVDNSAYYFFIRAPAASRRKSFSPFLKFSRIGSVFAEAAIW